MNKQEKLTLLAFTLLLFAGYFAGQFVGYVRGYNEAYEVCIEPINVPYYPVYEYYINTTDNTTLYHENGNYSGNYEVYNE